VSVQQRSSLTHVQSAHQPTHVTNSSLTMTSVAEPLLHLTHTVTLPWLYPHVLLRFLCNLTSAMTDSRILRCTAAIQSGRSNKGRPCLNRHVLNGSSALKSSTILAFGNSANNRRHIGILSTGVRPLVKPQAPCLLSQRFSNGDGAVRHAHQGTFDAGASKGNDVRNRRCHSWEPTTDPAC
jgi:hypothetical protein